MPPEPPMRRILLPPLENEDDYIPYNSEYVCDNGHVENIYKWEERHLENSKSYLDFSSI